MSFQGSVKGKQLDELWRKSQLGNTCFRCFKGKIISNAGIVLIKFFYTINLDGYMFMFVYMGNENNTVVNAEQLCNLPSKEAGII